MANSLQIKAEYDLISIIDMIYKICDHEQVISMFEKGPPKDQGFMWCDRIGGPGKNFTELQAKALKEISAMVLKYGWESSGYGIMMRKIQNKILNDSKIRKQFSQFKGKPAYNNPIYNDDEGKWDDDDRNGASYKSNH